MGYFRLGKTAPKTHRSGAISDARIASGVNGSKVAPGTIATVTLADGAVTTNKVADYAILAAKIAAGQIVDGHVAAGANINGNKLLNLSVTDAQIAAGITGSKVSGALTGATLAASALTAGVIPAGATINNGNWSGTALSNANLASGVDAAKITVGTVPLAVLSGITGAQLSATAGIASGQITSLDGGKLQAGTVPDSALSAVSGARLFGAVDGSLLTASTVANGALASGIDAAKLTTGTLPLGRLVGITTAQLAAAAGITGAQVAAGTLAESNIIAGTLTNASIKSTANIDASKLLAGSVTKTQMASHTLTTNEIDAAAGILGSQLSATAAIVDGQITGLAASKLSGTVSNAQLASGIDAAKLTVGTVPLAALSGITTTQLSATAGVTNGQLATALRQAFKARATKVSTLTNDGTLNPWNSEQLDNQNVFSAGTFTPAAATFGLIHVVLQLRGSLITPGCRGYIYMLEAGVTVAVGIWADAKTSGDTLLQPEIVAEFRTTWGFSAATAYTFAARVIDADGNAVANQLIADERLASPTAWSAAKVVVVGDHIRPSSTNGHGYRCTTAGTTSAAGHEPVFATGDYSTTNDNNNGGTSTVVWTEDGSTGLRIGSFIEFIPSPF